MIYTLLSLHDTERAKVATVIEEMRVLGAPIIRVVDCGDYYQALEGTHRLAACAALGVAPRLDILDQDDIVEADSLDWVDIVSGETYHAGELAGKAYGWGEGSSYKILDDGTIIQR